METKRDVADLLNDIECDKDIAQAARSEILMLRGLLLEALDSCDSEHEFGTDLHSRIVAAVSKNK